MQAQRQDALVQAHALAGDEEGAVAFILACPVAEARLVAAQAVHGRANLQRVHKAMRESDRRVARLMQRRIDTLVQADAAAQQAEAVVAEGEKLMREDALRPNQVVAFERAWQAIETPPPPTQAVFQALHARLSLRMQAQAALQRGVLDAIGTARAVAASSQPDLQAVASAVQDADATLALAQENRERSSLPKHLLPELAGLHQQLQEIERALAVVSAAVQQREQALEAWDAAPDGAPDNAVAPVESPAVTAVSDGQETDGMTVPTPTSPPAPESTPSPTPTLTPELMLQAWRSMPPLADPTLMQPLQVRFDAVLARLRQSTTPVTKPRSASAKGPAQVVPDAPAHFGADDLARRNQQRAAALEALQAAVEEGALQRAMEQDRILRTLDGDEAKLPAAQQSAFNSALSAARAELGRLQGWARWGGTISREELLAAVETLPQQALAVSELAKKVGSIRERWRALDASAGAAPRALWVRFDAACTAAYAPVAAHFATLAAERAVNADKAQALVNEITAFARDGDAANGQPGAESTDWRALAAFCQRMRQAWQRVGTLERKQQKRLDAAFAQAIEPLQQALGRQQADEAARREALIDAVTALAPQARDTPERVQALQARWQEQAKALPLERQQEQALWQRFRSACDDVFAARKSAGSTADAERSANLQAKLDLCTALEGIAAEVGTPATPPATKASASAAPAGLAAHADQGSGDQTRRVREIRAAWSACGAVPRAEQGGLQARFDAALAAIDARSQSILQAAARQKYEALQSKLRLCQENERQVVQASQPSVPDGASAHRDHWDHLPALPDMLEQVLRKRHTAAVQAAQAADTGYATLLQKNQAPRDAQLLQLEVACGLESPARCTRERLALQVAGLQSSFKTGTADRLAQSGNEKLARLCGLPALADDEAQRRIERLAQMLLAMA